MNQEKIGKYISEKRKKINLTQEQLAEKIGVSKNAVSKWERGLNLPDAGIMPELCSILNITLNELFAGNDISDDEYKEIADNNLLNALENSVFTLKDKIDFFKKKWEKDHFFSLIIAMLIIIIFIIYGFINDNGLQYIFMIIVFISGLIEHKSMTSYIKRNVYDTKTYTTKSESQDYLTRLKESKNLISEFKTKKEAINFLVKETGLSQQECHQLYDFINKLDLDKIKER